MSDLILTPELVQQIINSTEEFPVDFDNAWRWIGWNKKQDGRDVLFNNFNEGVDFLRKGVKTSRAGRPREFIVITVDCFKSLGMMAGTKQGKDVRKYFLDCERIAKTTNQMQPEMIRMMLSMQQELIGLSERTRRLDVVESFVSEIKDAALKHRGCGSIIYSELSETEEAEQLLTAEEYVLERGIPLTYVKTLSKRTAQFMRMGKGVKLVQKRKGRLLFERRYLDQVFDTLFN